MGKFSEQKMAKLDGRGEGPKTKEKFLKRYQGLTDVLFDNAKIFGFCYTQLYDIQQEINVLYTYDRIQNLIRQSSKKSIAEKQK